jgi:hydroxymethylglutaryl-CoA synthase
MEGVDCTNACYGGTNALFNSVNWLESSAWDGRYALVVCGDIAEYAAGPARPTGGAGIVVMLLGAHAPLVIDRGLRASHMEHAWDFYKPHLSSPFPVVDGHLSQTCFLAALDACFHRYCDKFEKRNGAPFLLHDSAAPAADFFVFHSPYNKLVQKSFARLYYSAHVLGCAGDRAADIAAALAAFPVPASKSLLPAARADPAYAASLTDRALEKALTGLAKADYEARVAPAARLPQRLGNMYTGSVYAGLLSLVAEKRAELAGKRLMMFSYGSGLAASMFSITVGSSAEAAAALDRIAAVADLDARLDARELRTPVDMNAVLHEREQQHHNDGSFTPEKSPALWDGEFYLVSKDDKGKRVYAKA